MVYAAKRAKNRCPTHPGALLRDEIIPATGRTKASYKVGDDSRVGLMLDATFSAAFTAAKERIRAMDYRYVEETDQNRQALLEIYCAVVLSTPYNDFGTH